MGKYTSIESFMRAETGAIPVLMSNIGNVYYWYFFFDDTQFYRVSSYSGSQEFNAHLISNSHFWIDFQYIKNAAKITGNML